MNETIKPLKVVNNALNTTNNHKLEIPSVCPWCKVSFNPIIRKIDNFNESGELTFVVRYHCGYCLKKSIAVLTSKAGETILRQRVIYPAAKGTDFPDELSEVSPRFIQLYHSAERSETAGDLDLAGMGYRAAMEILLKDSALKNSEDSKNSIAKLKIGQAIEKYFGTNPFGLVSADVVRLTANDFVHWDRPDNFDGRKSLDEIKAYLEIFIATVKVQQMVNHPPVERYQKK